MSKHNSDTIYEYKKIHPILEEDWNNPIHKAAGEEILRIHRTRLTKNKINELCIEQNHLMKDFELYKKAFKQFVREMREK